MNCAVEIVSPWGFVLGEALILHAQPAHTPFVASVSQPSLLSIKCIIQAEIQIVITIHLPVLSCIHDPCDNVTGHTYLLFVL